MESITNNILTNYIFMNQLEEQAGLINNSISYDTSLKKNRFKSQFVESTMLRLI